MRQYIVYTRIGPEDHGRMDVSISAQERDIAFFREHCATGPGTILARVNDQQMRTDAPRDGLDRALALCESTGAELLVARLDRLPFAVLDRPGLRLRVAALPDASRAELSVHARLTLQERGFDAARACANLAHSRARNWHTAAANDAGPDAKGQQAEAIARLLLPLHGKGATLRDMAAALNKAGLTTARGTAWRAAHVSRLLHHMDQESHLAGL